MIRKYKRKIKKNRVTEKEKLGSVPEVDDRINLNS